jgi:alpha-tubulin suppressor-like RCC1 family protein
VVGGITNWSQISAGGYHNLGLTATGILYAWGRNNEDQLGGNTTTSRSSPVTVVGGITNWSQVSAAYNHSLGLTATGILYAWGYNGTGQLGDNSTVSKSSPITVVGGITNWSQISAGGQHNLGLTDTGIAYAWGNGGQGRLGDNLANNRSSPVTVVGGITNWSQVSAGYNHSLGLTATGIVYAWGTGGYGMLGDNTTLSKRSPVTVVGGITNWSQVSAGSTLSAAITNTGIAYVWGRNQLGQLGDGTITNRSSPVTMSGVIKDWSQISAGGNSSGAHTLAISSTIKGFNEA